MRIRWGLAAEGGRHREPAVPGDERLRRVRAPTGGGRGTSVPLQTPLPGGALGRTAGLSRRGAAPRPQPRSRAGAPEGWAMAERLPPGLPVIFCQDSPKRILVSVIKTTPIKPREEPAAALPVPTSPGFSDFMVYPWRWGENAHNVTLSPGGTAALSGLPPPRAGAGRAPTGDEEEAGSLGGGGHRHLKVSATAGPVRDGQRS